MLGYSNAFAPILTTVAGMVNVPVNHIASVKKSENASSAIAVTEYSFSPLLAF